MNINFQPFFCSGYVQTHMSPEHREELDNIIIEDFDKSQIPYVTMKLDIKDDTDISDIVDEWDD